jgi:hypothetical protein
MQTARRRQARVMDLDLLYLDFDGVLHPESVYVNSRQGIHLRDAPGRNLFENCQLLIEELARYPHVKVVLSTSWVRSIGFDRARGRLPLPLQARCIGATYHSRFHQPGREDGARSLRPAPLRGEEVMADVQRRRPHKWLALDDTDEGWPDEERNNLILTHPFYGISAPTVRQALHAELGRFG